MLSRVATARNRRRHGDSRDHERTSPVGWPARGGLILVMSSGGVRRDETCAGRLCEIRTLFLRCVWGACGVCEGLRRRRLEAVELIGLLAGDQTDLHEVERADEPVADAEPAGARDRVA
jgi:hypothetical protein